VKWESSGSFDGTVNGDTIAWNPSNTSWKRLPPSLKACVDVSGHWAHQQIPKTLFDLSQDGDKVVSEGSFGHAEGEFTASDRFSLKWQTIGTFDGTVKDDTISWKPSDTTWKRQD
jgi:hypothetical protein